MKTETEKMMDLARLWWACFFKINDKSKSNRRSLLKKNNKVKGIN